MDSTLLLLKFIFTLLPKGAQQGDIFCAS